MLKSRTLMAGESIAHCKAQPLDTASSWFKVVLGCFPKTTSIRCLIAGMRLEPPTISTACISSRCSSDIRDKIEINNFSLVVQGKQLNIPQLIVSQTECCSGTYPSSQQLFKVPLFLLVRFRKSVIS